MTPTISELKRFLDVFNSLDEFEAQTRHLRGYGAFDKDTPMPIPEVVKVIAWLRAMAEAGGRLDSHVMHNLELLAAQGRIMHLQSELQAAAGQFLFYADNHGKKNPPDKEKQAVNAGWAERLLRAGSPGEVRVTGEIYGVDNSGGNGGKS